jgi:hypothetical protein
VPACFDGRLQRLPQHHLDGEKVWLHPA